MKYYKAEFTGGKEKEIKHLHDDAFSATASSLLAIMLIGFNYGDTEIKARKT